MASIMLFARNFRGRGSARWSGWPRGIARVLLGAALLGLGPAGGIAEAAVNGAFKGQAYGTSSQAIVGPIATRLGKSALQPCPCSGTNGKVRTNSITELSVGPGGQILTAGAVVSKVRTQRLATESTAQNSNEIIGINLLEGLITADAVKVVANMTATAASIAVNANGTTFLNLRIGGQAIAANPAPGTVINLPGIGNVTLNKRSTSGNGTTSRLIEVTGMVINVTTANSLGLPVGARIVVAFASAGFTRTPVNNFTNGEAFATLTNSKVGQTLRARAGKTAYVTIPCEGTNGNTRTNNIAAIDVGSLLSLGSGSTTAFGALSASTVTARTSSTIQSVKLLKNAVFPNGIIQATAVVAAVEVKLQGGTRTVSTAGSGFGSIKVLGVTLNPNVQPNTEIQLPGIGFVRLNEQIKRTTAESSVVSGITLVVTTANAFNLPVGARIVIGRATAGVTG